MSEKPSLLGDYCSQLRLGVLRRDRLFAERAAKIEAEKAVAVKSKFIAMMSHELRTPLNSIIGFSELLGRAGAADLDAEKVREYANYINNSGRDLARLLDDILEIAKLQSRVVTVEPEESSLGELSDLVFRPFQEEARFAGVSLLTAFPPEFPPIHVDQPKFAKILSNLVANAIRYNRPGGSVTIGGEVTPDGRIRIIVADSGIGMEAEEIGTALTPFGRLDDTNGVGLGLNIARELTELHGGTFAVESAKGRGTTVSMTFERLAGAAGEAKAA